MELGARGDRLERQADAISGTAVDTLSGAAAAAPTITRVAHGGRAAETPPAALARLHESVGHPLDADTRRLGERALGRDLGGVQVHSDTAAREAARAVRARAFTWGRHVFLASGEPVPRTEPALRLLVHELVHTVQQEAAASPIVQRQGEEEPQEVRGYDPRREILTLAAFGRRYEDILGAFTDLEDAMTDLHSAVERYGPRGLGAGDLPARYARAWGNWNQAAEVLDPYWSVVRVMAASVRAEQVLVVVNDMVRRQRVAGRGFGASAPSLLERPHRQAQGARGRLARVLSARPEARRVHEVVAEEAEEERARERARALEREREGAGDVASAQVALRRYVARNYPAVTETTRRHTYGLAVARLLRHELGTDASRYIALFQRLEAQSPEFYRLVLFRGLTISHLADMGVSGLEGHVYRETERVGTHVLLGSWDFEAETGRERDAPGVALVFDILVGIVPLLGQAADARDISGYVYRIGRYESQRSSGWTWLGLVGSLVGLIPAAGDAAKSLLAAMRRGLVELPMGRLSDDVVRLARGAVGDRIIERLVNAADDLAHALTLRWTILQGRALNYWDRIVARVGPFLVRVSDLTRAELDLVRRAAAQHLPQTLQLAGRWIGQLVRSFWVWAKLSAVRSAEDLMELIRGFRARWNLSVEAFHELWSPTARFLARLTPAERAAVRLDLRRLAASEADDVAEGISRLLREEEAAARPAVARGAEGARAPRAAEAMPPRPAGTSTEAPPPAGRRAARSESAERSAPAGPRPTEAAPPRRAGMPSATEARREVSGNVGRLRRSFEPGYAVEVPVGEGVVWRRTPDGVWCRFASPACPTDRAVRDALDELMEGDASAHSLLDETLELTEATERLRLARERRLDALARRRAAEARGDVGAVAEAERDLERAREEIRGALADVNRLDPRRTRTAEEVLAGPEPAAEEEAAAVAPAAEVEGAGASAPAEAPAAAPSRAATAETAGAAPVRQVDSRAYDTPETYLDALRAQGPRSPGDLGPGWDHARFPRGPRRGWRPGDPIDMPSSSGVYPTFATARGRAWRNIAHAELEARAAGAAGSGEAIGVLTDAELRALRDTPTSRVSPPIDPFGGATMEIEHFGVPQRVEAWMRRAGFTASEARRIAGVADPRNLLPVSRLEHAFFDVEAHGFGSLRADVTGRAWQHTAAADPRATRPLAFMTDDRIVELVRLATARPGIELRDAPGLLGALRAEIAARGLDIDLP